MELKHQDVIIRPLVTERSMKLHGFGKYVFQVHSVSNKTQIKKSVENLFKVKVKKVNVISVRGKRRQFGRAIGKTSDWKKAIVTLMPGEKIIIKGIELFEEA